MCTHFLAFLLFPSLRDDMSLMDFAVDVTEDSISKTNVQVLWRKLLHVLFINFSKSLIPVQMHLLCLELPQVCSSHYLHL